MDKGIEGLQKFEKVQALVAQGEHTHVACKKVGMAYSNYYRIRKEKGLAGSRSKTFKVELPDKLQGGVKIEFTTKQFAEFCREVFRG